MMLPRVWRSLTHPSLRLKVTLGFTVVMGVLLFALGVFIYDRFRSSLDASLNAGLRARTADVHAFVEQANEGLEVGRRGSLSVAPSDFVQVLTPGAKIVQQTAGIPRVALLDASQRVRASAGPIWVTGTPDVAIGRVRMLATPVRAQGVSMLIVAGVSLRERDAALSRLLAVMLLGGPVALLVASLLGYGVASISLRGVEAMRAKASQLSLGEPGGRLPVPRAADELRRLALTLNEMLQRNEAAYSRQRRFVADASHELRSPLTVLKAEIEVALAGGGTAKELRAALMSADAEVDHVSQVAYDLLTLAQADDGQLAIERSEMPVGELFQRLHRRFERRAASQQRALHLANAPDLNVFVDPLRVEQALANLMENALRHGRGAITISAAPAENGLLGLHIADEGAGFPQDYLEVAFERFSRPDRARTEPGSGLGLSIVRSIARVHGGEAYIANRADGGADAWVTLPCVAPSAPTVLRADAAAQQAEEPAGNQVP
jgi:two-component system OmpR family sensor kinase